MRQHGDLRIWIADDVTDHWTVAGKCTPKGDPIYTDLAIETVLTLRQIEGFVNSILMFMGLDLPVPNLELSEEPTLTEAFTVIGTALAFLMLSIKVLSDFGPQ